MISGRAAESKSGINPATRTLSSTSNRKSGNNLTAGRDPSFHPLPASNIASSTRPETSMGLPRSSVPDSSAPHGVNPTGVDENDIIIAVMGPVGVGKSSFVNKAAGRTEVVIGYDLKSQTRSVQPIRCTHPDGRQNIVLVDTPGFDDTYLSDTHILRITAHWLRETYQNDIKLAGILYLHRISDNRMGGTPLRNLAVFKDLCGDGNLKNIVLVTTMWDEIDDQSVGSKREEELRSKYWKDMIQLGSDTHRFHGTRESAWEIIERLRLNEPRQTRTPLQIQREMVDRHLPFHETAAAKTLLRLLVAEFKKVWARMRNGVRRAVGTRTRRPSEDQRRNALSRTSTIESHTSGTTSSVVSASTSSSSSHSSPLPSPAESTSTGCSANRRQEALSGMITSLRLTYQMADMVQIPVLRGAIGTVLQIAQAIEGMGGTHHTIRQVIEYSAWLLEEITQFAVARGSELTDDTKKTLDSFQKELKKLQKIVKKISARSHLARFSLYDADIRAITACTTAIRGVYDKLEVRLAMDNRQAIARLEEQLKALISGGTLRQCECGRLVVREEAADNEQPSTSEDH